MLPQLIVPSELVTVPVNEPEPLLVTANVYCPTKVADTDVLAFIATVHVPVPAQAEPPQPLNEEPAAGAAVRVTLVPWA